MKTKLILTGLTLMAATALLSAQCPENGKGKCDGKGKGTGFVDANKNGICDKYEKRAASDTTKCCNGKGQGKGKHFVDANKNGVCDNYEARSKK
jgi:hypothetical protein